MQLAIVTPPTLQGTADDPLVPRAINNVTMLTQIEAWLRAGFAKLLPDLTALQAAGKDVPPALLDLMQRHNAAVASFTDAAKIWLYARQQVPRSELPDPDARPVAIPTFELPSGLGRLGGVSASAVRLRVGFLGKEMSVPLSGYSDSAFAGFVQPGGQLGGPEVFWVIGILLGLVITGTIVYGIVRELKKSEISAANQAISDQARARAQEVASDNILYTSTRDKCIGDSASLSARLRCIEAASEALRAAKEGRPGIRPPVTATTSFWTILSILALAGAAGYVIYRRRQAASGRFAPEEATA
jgi:hypothetical protein